MPRLGAVAWVELGWQQDVASATGAVGLMQLEPYSGEWVSQYLAHRTLDRRPRTTSSPGLTSSATSSSSHGSHSDAGALRPKPGAAATSRCMGLPGNPSKTPGADVRGLMAQDCN